MAESKIKGLNFEKMLEEMPASQKWKDVEKDWRRMQTVLELKEEHLGLLGKIYLIRNNLVTLEEYKRYKGKSEKKIEWENNAAMSYAATHPVIDMCAN